jgi:hypothetical protein
MTRLHKICAVVLGVVVLAVLRPMFEPVASGKDADPVTVVNTPLPVTLQGTGQISGNVSVVGSVNVANDASAPIPVGNFAPGPLTHIGRMPSDHVVLINFGPGNYVRVFPDGNQDVDTFAIPRGSVLVVTDVEWAAIGGSPGDTATTQIGFSVVPGVFAGVYVSTAQFGSDGRAGKSDHLTGGLVFSKVPILSPNSLVSNLVLRVYLMPAS